MTPPSMTLQRATRMRLEESSGVVMYSDIRAHLDRDVVFVVASTLSLIDCAVAIAVDDVQQVEPWIAGGSLRKPSRKERESWPMAQERRWRAVVVRPFVLIQDP